MDALIAAGIIGIIGGIIGSLFIRVNNRVNLIRKKLLGPHKGRRIIECIILVVITTTSMFLSSYYRNCVTENDADPIIKQHIEVKIFNCPDGYYNRLATLFFDG
jgi:hypothetical protein